MKTNAIEVFIRESGMLPEESSDRVRGGGSSDISTINRLDFMMDMEYACMGILPAYRVPEGEKKSSENNTKTFFE